MQIVISIDDEKLEDLIKKVADDEQRSLRNLTTYALIKYVKDHAEKYDESRK